MNKKIGIATVFYNPDEAAIENFKSLSKYGYLVAVTNNGMAEDYILKLKSDERIIILGDGKNIGLAKGMNDAIDAIFRSEINVEAVIQFDQDSKPEISLPIHLKNTYDKESKERNIACIGPLIRDRKSLINNGFQKTDGVISAETIATSGTYIPRKVFEKIGPLKENLFIDCIDHEWCFRARNLKYEILIDKSVEMIHDMGEDGIDWFGVYKPIYKTPIRHYYIIRNTLFLMGCNYVPLNWRFLEFLKTIRRIIFYIIFSNNRKETMRNIISAFLDAMQGRLGEKR